MKQDDAQALKDQKGSTFRDPMFLRAWRNDCRGDTQVHCGWQRNRIPDLRLQKEIRGLARVIRLTASFLGGWRTMV